MLCPSAVSPESVTAVLLLAPQSDGTKYTYNPAYGNALGFTFSGNPGSVVLGRTNYVPMGGYPIFNAGDGIPDHFAGIFGYNKSTKVTDITDGTSNTILVAEYASAKVNFGTTDALTGPCAGAWGGGFMYTYWAPDPKGQGLDSSGNAMHYAYGSRHTGIFQVCMADGSVRGLKNGIDYSTWVVIGGKADGVVLTGDN